MAPLTKQSVNWSIADLDFERLSWVSRCKVRIRSIESSLAMLASSMAISLALGSLAFSKADMSTLAIMYHSLDGRRNGGLTYSDPA